MNTKLQVANLHLVLRIYLYQEMKRAIDAKTEFSLGSLKFV